MRTIIWFTYFWLYLLLIWPSYYRLKKLKEPFRTQEASKRAREWAKRLLKLAGCHLHVEGHEQIPTDQAVLFVSNHQGAFDIPILLSAIERPVGFIAKEELEALPFVGKWMHLMQCVFIKRGNPREAIKAITEGIKKLKSGHAMILFPEGTRSKDGLLLPFKPGSLKLATKSEVMVIPVVIKGSIDLMKKDSLWIQAGHVTVTFLEGIPFDPERDSNALADLCQERIGNRLKI